MMTIPELIRLALKDGTKERAEELVKQRVAELVKWCEYTEDEARRLTLHNVGYYSAYLDPDTADKVLELFGTEHPYFGKKHPSGEEAYRMGKEYERQKKENV